MIINEYEPATTRQFYKFWAVEWQMRRFAKFFFNTYMMAFCACNREAYHPHVHRGMSKEEALTIK